MKKPIEARERYLAIAERRFAETGFHGVSLATLAQDAGVTKQALLHFFGTKERLYAEVLTRLDERLCSEVDAVEAATPAERLIAYFDTFAAAAVRRSDDARLVARALLDADAKARFWPLKPFTDALVSLALQTPRWRDTRPEEPLAGISAMIGAIQYMAVASTALRGMYGARAQKAVEARFLADMRAAVRAFVAQDQKT